MINQTSMPSITESFLTVVKIQKYTSFEKVKSYNSLTMKCNEFSICIPQFPAYYFPCYVIIYNQDSNVKHFEI